MNRSSKELKRLARENLTGRYNVPMGAFVCASAITLAVELAFSTLQSEQPTTAQTIVLYVAEFLISLLSSVLTAGVLRVHLSMARKQPYELKQLFFGFRNHPDRYILSALIVSVLTLLSCIPLIAGILLFFFHKGLLSVLLLAVLGIISAIFVIYVQLAFQLTNYLLLDHSGMNVMQSLKESMRLMKGQKGRFFYILISFLGMDLLMLLSLGIGALWIMPYKTQTTTLFYLDIIGQIPDPASAASDFSNIYK